MRPLGSPDPSTPRAGMGRSHWCLQGRLLPKAGQGDPRRKYPALHLPKGVLSST